MKQSKDMIFKNSKRKYETGKRVLAVDRYADNDDIRSGYNNNDLIIGCSGSGKTGGYVIPNIRRLCGSIVVTDTKSQLSRMFTSELKAKGFKVYTIDFAEPDRSMGYNPLAYIRRIETAPASQGGPEAAFSNKDIVSLAHILCPVRTVKDPFWEESARTVLTFLIAFVLEAMVTEEHNIISVVDVYRQLTHPDGRKAIELWCEENPDTFAAKKFAMFRQVLDVERTWGCICQFLSEALEPFDFSEIQCIYKCTQPSNILDLEQIGMEPTVVFLNVSDTDRYADTLVNLFYTQLLQITCRQADRMPDGRLKVPVRFILDDFAANTQIANFDKLISVIRSRNISVSIILQNLTQLESMYSGSQASTILNNCDHILYLGGQDIKTAQYIGFRCNKPEEYILLMPFDKAYLIERGKFGELVDKIPPYAEKSLFSSCEQEL